ncbi:phage tail sheath subtilisin-like domain-containing protein [Prosthecochloris sp.]|uniref:phage tail sheath subtilisin-like domain-containing protein n=1 Tax=Prosthecochloris sp. TaxID=290513 RepID=UPI0025DEEEEA|nr:phage tail sheath subtilisin-like domain-containing protein [Prosthecochloris sp.]
MPANYLHGVETIIIEKGPRPITGVKTAVIGLVGTAPMLDVANVDRTINEPVVVRNPVDAAKFFGTNRTGFTIPAALDAIFDQGNGPICIVINTIDPESDVSAVTAEEKTFSADEILTLDHPQVSSVVVKNDAGSTTYVAGDDYTVDEANGKITRISTGAIASGASVKVNYSWLDPSKITASDIIGEVDVDGNRSGLQALIDTYNLFGYVAKMIIAPGYCTQNAVAVEMLVVADKLRAMALIDAPIGTTVAEAITGRGNSGSINFNTSNKRAILCFPHVKRYDTATNTEVLEPLSQRLAGVIAAKDVEKGYWWSPSNTEIKGIVGMETPITALINDSTTEANALNEVGIVTLFNSFGSGIRTWGNRSAAFPTNTSPENFINVQRTADILHESLEYSMLQFLDRPINLALIDSIRESVNGFMRTLIQRGALIDGMCVFDPAKNSETELAAGHLTFDLEFMPPTPAERITFESYINIELLKALLQ